MPQSMRGSIATLILLATGSLSASTAAPTSTALSIIPGGSVGVGTVVTLVATVTGPSVSTGSVTFCDASSTYCQDTAILGTGTAVKIGPTTLVGTIRLRLGVGTHRINATFQPTAFNLGSSSLIETLNVTSDPIYSSATTLTSNGTAGDYTLDGIVTGFGNQSLLGSLIFFDTSSNSLQLGTVSLNPASWTFTPPVFLSTNTYPVANVAGDFNGDGKLDLATISDTSAGTISVLLGNGNGTFQARRDYPADAHPSYLVVGDFNGDGKLDLAAVSGQTAGLLSVYLGNGDGTFQAKVDLSVDPNPYYVAIGDINKDGVPDLVILSSPSNLGVVSIMLGNGDGTFQPKIDYSTDATPASVSLGDFNRDSNLDLAVAYNAAAEVSIFLGNGDGSFQAKVDYPTNTPSNSVTIGDFNGDGKLDLVTNDSSTDIAIFLGNGDGSFQAKVDYPTSWPAESLVIGDFNQDGKTDIAFTNGGVGTISLMFGNGDGSFQPLVNLGNTVYYYPILVGDFNGDGVQDIVGAGYGTFVLFGEQAASYRAGDISILGTGIHNVVAAYQGDASRIFSQSSPVSLIASPGVTTVSLSTNQNPSRYGSDVVISAFMTAVDGVNPTGTVTFDDGGTILGSSMISDGTASFTISNLSAGMHTLTSIYNGDSNYLSAASAPFFQTINELSLGSYAPNQPALVFVPSQITTIIGTGIAGENGDGDPGAEVKINRPAGTALDSTGTLYISDQSNNRIRKLNSSTGSVATAVGTGIAGFSGDGGPASNATINSPGSLSLDQSGNLYFSDSSNACIRRVDATSNIITTVAGICTSSGYSGDGGKAINARLNVPTDVTLDQAGNLFIADSGNSCIRKVAVESGIISTVAGVCGVPGFSGDGGPAIAAHLNGAEHVILDSIGNLYIADTNNNRVREVDSTALAITTIVGTGGIGFSGDDGPAIKATLRLPSGLSFDASGNLYIADQGNDVVRMISAITGAITTVVGTGGVSGYQGDGEAATEAELWNPVGVTVSPSGVLYISDQNNDAIRMVGPSAVLDFGPQAVGSQGNSMTQTIANYGNTLLAFRNAPIVTGDFSIQSGNSCGSSALVPGATCTLTIDFTPTAVGMRTGTIQFNGNVSSGGQALYLHGMGTAGSSGVLLSATMDPSTYGAAITFTANIPSGATGTVTFKDNGITLGSIPVSGGVASITTTSLSVGTHTITGVYGGDSNFSGSVSADLYQTVNKASARLNLTSSTNPSIFGMSLTLTATVVVGATGFVTFTDGSTNLGTVTLTSGAAALTTSSLSPGSHSIVATYSGDSNYQ